MSKVKEMEEVYPDLSKGRYVVMLVSNAAISAEHADGDLIEDCFTGTTEFEDFKDACDAAVELDAAMGKCGLTAYSSVVVDVTDDPEPVPMPESVK